MRHKMEICKDCGGMWDSLNTNSCRHCCDPNSIKLRTEIEKLKIALTEIRNDE
jgi:hypothetical protein